MYPFFVENKCKNWLGSQSTILPSEIKDKIPTTHVAKNPGWENKKPLIEWKKITIYLSSQP